MPKKIVLMIFVAGLTLGYIIPRNSNLTHPLLSADRESQDKLNNLKDKMQKISEEDINEYIQLKDMKAKYEKADEIFGKILSLFLLDLGLKMSEKQIEDLKTSSPTLSENNQPIPPEEAKISEAESIKPVAQASAEKTYGSHRNLESDEKTSKLFNEKILSNPIATWSAAKPINRQTFNLIDGHFTGNIFFVEPDKTPLDLEMELSGASFEKGHVLGEFLLKTTDPSNPKYRDTTRYEPNSKIPNFRLADDGALLVEAMGGDGIFQLYYFKQNNSFQGSLYEKRGLDSFKRTGSILLNRR